MMFVVSCSSLLKKKDDDAGSPEASTAEIADTGTAPAPAALAANEGDVARFPDEVKIANVAATFQRPYNVREAPPAGASIATLPKGTAVTEISQRDKYFLITFDSKTAPGTTLMGWVHKDAFSISVADAGPLTCSNGEVPLWSDTPFCGKICGSDTDCSSGYACKGSANKLLANGKAGDGVQVCTAYVRPDAGLNNKRNLFAGDAAIAKIDAAPVPVPPTPANGTDVVAKPANGVCPVGFLAVTKTGKCHRACPASITACSSKDFCVKCDADQKRVCVDDRNACK